MFLSHRARVVCAKEQGVPAEDVLRFAHPKNYVKVLGDVAKAFSSKAADEGLAFLRMMTNKWKGPVHPAFSWKREVSVNNAGPPASDRATGAIKSVVDVVGAIKDSRREAVFGGEALSFRVRAMYIGLASKVCKTCVRRSRPVCVERCGYVGGFAMVRRVAVRPFAQRLQSQARSREEKTGPRMAQRRRVHPVPSTCRASHPWRHAARASPAERRQSFAHVAAARHPQFRRKSVPVREASFGDHHGSSYRARKPGQPEVRRLVAGSEGGTASYSGDPVRRANGRTVGCHYGQGGAS